MTLLIKLAVLALSGYGAHKATYPICIALDGRAGWITGKVIACMMVMTGGTLIADELHEVSNQHVRHFLADLIATVAICIGVGAGHIMDAVGGDE